MTIRALRTAAVVLTAIAACGNTAAIAAPPQPLNLAVVGDAGAWRSDTHFQLTWTIPPIGDDPPLVAAHYRVRSPSGVVIEKEEIPWTNDAASVRTWPGVEGVYTAEVWLEDSAGDVGPAVAAPLRFDDARPAAIGPVPIRAWLGRSSFPLRLRLAHPSGPLPLSGLRGYSIAIDSTPDGVPCGASARCSDAETTLREGIEDDKLEIADLLEGTHYLHAVAVSNTGMKSATTSTVLRVDRTDPVTTLSGAPAGWTNRAVTLTASAGDTGSGMAPTADGPTPFTAIRVDDEAPETAHGLTAAATVIAEGVHRVSYYARDAAGNVDDGSAANGVPDPPPRTAWVRIDRTPPLIAFANSQDPRDPDLIRARIADPLSGPDLSRGRIGVRRVGSGDPFELLPTAPPAPGELRARWDSGRHPLGEYEFEAIGYDDAGNLTVATQRMNGAPMVLVNPLKATTTLDDAFLPRGLSRTVPYGRRVLLRGRLTTGLSSTLGGRPVQIVERFAPGAHPAVRVSSVETGPGGSFSIRSASGPSRTIELHFSGTPTLAPAVGPTLRLDVLSRIRFRASAGSARVGGRPLVFAGRAVAGPGTIPSEGIPVQLQFRVGDSPWNEFRTVQTDHRGHFRYAYRFTDDDSRGARFQFRAYLPARENWPYSPASSRPLLVRGR